ncbi:c-type cytochrome [Microvirga sp. BSC39]|uniref:c-type cytochrome n=1 Tax=Microvirga sp. BSC39 TaxID=1549810 RepID=UPI000A728252|nr:c-type cytochrome [Microvirga sp. BSC39]
MAVTMMAEAVPAAAQGVAPPGATACSGCHGPVAPGAAVAPLHGRPSEEIVAAMQDFRTGQRPATVMDRIAKGFTDEETRAIASWLSQQP